MGLGSTDLSVLNGILAIIGICGAFVLAVYSLTLPPPPTGSSAEHRAEERGKQIYTRHDLWRW